MVHYTLICVLLTIESLREKRTVKTIYNFINIQMQNIFFFKNDFIQDTDVWTALHSRLKIELVQNKIRHSYSLLNCKRKIGKLFYSKYVYQNVHYFYI